MSTEGELNKQDWDVFSPDYVIRSAEGRRFFPDVRWDDDLAARGSALLTELRESADEAASAADHSDATTG